MTRTVSLNQVGLVRASEILHQARNEAARRHQTEPRTVSVDLDRQPLSAGMEERGAVPEQRRAVDIQF